MSLYAAFDLHANNSYLAIVDDGGKCIFKRKLMNEPGSILKMLRPYRDEISGIAVESTFNWYWLVDLLMDEGYKTHLANPSAIQKYKGLKHNDDKSDALWLADLLRLNILPEGYIYPRRQRPLRDLLRKRSHLVKLRTSLILSLQNIITRNYGLRIGGNEIKLLTKDTVTPLFEQHSALELSGKVSKETIDYLTRQINRIEREAEKAMDPPELHKYEYLKTIPGVGKILSLTITLETGPIERFPKVGSFSSYCRKVPANWISNGKKKGSGNKKNGNRYLAWSFSEAAEFARRNDPTTRKYYNRKASKTDAMVARATLAHKLSRAAYYIMRDQVPFDANKLFA